MRVFVAAIFLLATLVAVQAYNNPPSTDGEGCPDGHQPGDKFDVKPGCSQCICHRDASQGHFCRQCPSLTVMDIPGFKKVFDETRPYPSCCYPKYVRE